MRVQVRRRWPAIAIIATVIWALLAPAALGLGVRPVDGPVVRGFDPPEKRWLAGHRGVDLRASAGTPVRAAADGSVGFVGKVGGKPVVTVVHGTLRTTYEPVDATVSVGDRVRAGAVIGHLVEGHDCGGDAKTCLHLGLRRGDTYLNPLLLFEPPEIRLLSEAEAASIAKSG